MRLIKRCECDCSLDASCRIKQEKWPRSRNVFFIDGATPSRSGRSRSTPAPPRKFLYFTVTLDHAIKRQSVISAAWKVTSILCRLWVNFRDAADPGRRGIPPKYECFINIRGARRRGPSHVRDCEVLITWKHSQGGMRNLDSSGRARARAEVIFSEESTRSFSRWLWKYGVRYISRMYRASPGRRKITGLTRQWENQRRFRLEGTELLFLVREILGVSFDEESIE